MRGSIRRARISLMVLFALAVLVPGAVAAQPVAQNPDAQNNEDGLLQRLDAARVSRNAETGKVALIGASKSDPISRPDGLSPDASPAAAARAHLDEVGPLFGVENQARELNSQGTEAVGNGRYVTRFRQVYKEVPVLGGEIHVQTTGSNALLSANGEALPNISLDTEPGVSADEARDAALASTAKQYEQNTGDLDASEPDLWIYDAGILGGPGLERPALVWRLEVTSTAGQPINELVLVDAHLGSVALNIDQIEHALNRQICDAANTSTQVPCTSPVRVEGGPAHAVADVNFAYDYAGDTYDFYNDNHGRDSIDDAGLQLKSTVRYCDPAFACPYQNAFWNGNQMVYGQGFAAADDVVGHELTHGVTDYESNLFYYYQSGAINESFSDVWGEFVDLTNASGTDNLTTRWQIGEDIPGGAIRDMENPGLFADPDRMQSPNYTADTAEEDGGGVHSNSGVNNKAAFLMTDGGTFNGHTVTGLGITKAAKIYYEVQTNMLTSAGDYNDLHATLRQACANLTGTSGITTANCQEVADAVNATEMNLQATNAPATEAPVCDTGESASNLFSDDLENPASGNWIKTGNWYYPQNPNLFAGFDTTYATSGTTNFWGYNQPSTGDYSIARTGNVTPPAGATTYLRFNHAYGFEDGTTTAFDGGVLEYSTNNGVNWIDAGSLITDNGYTGAISASSNPLNGRQAFVRESNGYISSRADLSSLAGQSVRFRFRIGTDSSIDDYGWFIDDVRVYSCAPDAANTPPVANGDSYNANQGATLTVPNGPTDVLANDTDADGDSLTVAAPRPASGPSHGLLTLNANGSFSYTPHNGFAGTDAFSYKANDGSADSNTATVTITVADTTKPRVTRVVPAENATGIGPTTNVLATFSEPMRSASVTANVKLYRVGATKALEATVTYDPATRRATLNPNASLVRGARYKAVVSTGARDVAGNPLDQSPATAGNQAKMWFFTIRN